MKVVVLVVGKTEELYLQEGIAIYLNRLKHYINVTFTVLPALKNSKNLTHLQQKEKESDLLLKSIGPTDCIVLLSEEGKSFKSVEFARYIENAAVNSIANIIFIVGGPFGVDDRIRKRANLILSLSAMTFSHQMVRLFFVEQLYRAMTILKGEGYHHE
jgi:23S rRNA (pseudouridine1915-N3)-methyltransferase